MDKWLQLNSASVNNAARVDEGGIFTTFPKRARAPTHGVLDPTRVADIVAMVAEQAQTA
ncbi:MULTISPECIES: hypothetical protein [Bradyrhizobium]|uniref:hypothetical protein n=1 Tax=Bradyrhizobium TaxID=374 RepID=UPI0013029253|nr:MULTISPECIES: hypothetical protein [Bradyrhizobium]WOH62213.1 hypothetical protein RX329_19775 [Bradyrhizobium sp. BWC-3-1]